MKREFFLGGQRAAILLMALSAVSNVEIGTTGGVDYNEPSRQETRAERRRRASQERSDARRNARGLKAIFKGR